MVRFPPVSVTEKPWSRTFRGATLQSENCLVSNRQSKHIDCSSGLLGGFMTCLCHLSPCLSTIVLWAMPPASLLCRESGGASEEDTWVLEMARCPWRGCMWWCLFTLAGVECSVRKAEADCLVCSDSNSPSPAGLI